MPGTNTGATNVEPPRTNRDHTVTDMPDDSLPDLDPGLAAASAHFDGVAEPTERAAVEASPELQRLVASFGTVKAALNDVPAVEPAEVDHVVVASGGHASMAALGWCG